MGVVLLWFVETSSVLSLQAVSDNSKRTVWISNPAASPVGFCVSALESARDSCLVLCPNCSHGSKCLLDKKKNPYGERSPGLQFEHTVIAVLKQGWDLWGIHDPLKSGVNGERKQNTSLSPPWPHRIWGWEQHHVLGMLPALTSKRFWSRNNQAGIWQLLHQYFCWYLLTGGFAPAFVAVDILDWGPEPTRLNV